MNSERREDDGNGKETCRETSRKRATKNHLKTGKNRFFLEDFSGKKETNLIWNSRVHRRICIHIKLDTCIECIHRETETLMYTVLVCVFRFRFLVISDAVFFVVALQFLRVAKTFLL